MKLIQSLELYLTDAFSYLLIIYILFYLNLLFIFSSWFQKQACLTSCFIRSFYVTAILILLYIFTIPLFLYFQFPAHSFLQYSLSLNLAHGRSLFYCKAYFKFYVLTSINLLFIFLQILIVCSERTFIIISSYNFSLAVFFYCLYDFFLFNIKIFSHLEFILV